MPPLVSGGFLNYRVIRACAGLCFALLLVCAATARADFATFAATGTEQQWMVPAGVTSIRVIAIGGQGGGAKGGEFETGVAGLGAIASADLPVTPGQVLYVEVGTNGSDAKGQTGGAGGFNGGGAGGNSGGERSSGGGGGGGATDLRTLPRAAAGSLTTRLIVAGGGGGGGGARDLLGDDFNARGGDAEAGGLLSGQNGGGGATPTVGGNAGGNGQAGQLGVGGFGGFGSSSLGVFGAGGGGGGGGAFGGGGGGGNTVSGPETYPGGGGGGSSAFAPGATNTSRSIDSTGVPGLTILYTPAPAGPPTPRLGSLPSSLTVAKNRHYTFSFSATPGLPGTVNLVTANKYKVSKKKKKKLALATKAFSAPASGAVSLDLTLSKKAFGLLANLGRFRANATVTLNGGGGLTDTATKSIVLRAAKPRR